MGRFYIILLLSCFSFLPSNAQNIELYQQFNGRYSFTMFGNTLNPNDNSDGTDPCSMTIASSSAADLNLAADETPIAAFLYWSGPGTGDLNVVLDGNRIAATRTFAINFSGNNYFGAFADISTEVITKGNGTYTLSDLNLSVSPACNNSTNYGGWAVFVVYEKLSLPLNSVKLYDGFQRVSGGGAAQTVRIELDNILVVDPNGSRLAFLAWEGDVALNNGEQASINGNVLTNALNPPNAQFNSTNSFTNSTDLFNMDLDVYEIENFLAIGDQVADIEISSAQDLILVNAVGLSLNNELPDPTVAIQDAVNQSCDDRLIDVDFRVGNFNATDILLAGTPVDFYVNDASGIRLGSSATTIDLNIDEFEDLSITLDIPATVAQDFTLFAIVNDDGMGNGIVLELDPNNNADRTEVHIIENTVSQQDPVICDNDMFMLPDGTSTNVPGTYTNVIPNADNCDSTITTILTVNPTFDVAVDTTICASDPFMYPNGDPKPDAPGTYVQVSMLSTNNTMCDSAVTTTLIINPEYDVPVTTEICTGDTFTYPDGSPGENTPGTYTQTSMLQSRDMCDSVVVTTLTVHPSFDLADAPVICEGDGFTYPDGTVAPVAAGTYTQISNLLTANGCDSIITTTLLINPSYDLTNTVEVCETNSYTYPDGTAGESDAGTYSQTSLLTTSQNCDSIIVTTLIVYPEYLDLSEDVSICDDGTYTLPDGTIVSEPGAYVSNLTTVAFGCDSIITSNVTVNPTYFSEVSKGVCDGAGYTLPDGTIVTSSGIYPVTLPSSRGCDSTIVTTVGIDTVYTFMEDAEICVGETFTLQDGSQVNTTGVYSVNFVTDRQCDSTFITTLTVNPTFNISEPPVEVCEGDSYVLPDGREVTTAGDYISNLLSADNCDSVVNSTLIVNPVFTTNRTDTFCQGSTFVLPDGMEVSEAGDYSSLLTTIEGCDSTVLTDLFMIETQFTDIEAILCVGDGYTLPDGTRVNEPGVYTTILQQTNRFACDSIITTNLVLGEIHYPTAFTPTNNNQNDKFFALPGIECLGFIGNYNLQIFNKWGELVFETNEYAEGWDGLFNGENSMPGFYTWHASYTFAGEDVKREGGVTLLR